MDDGLLQGAEPRLGKGQRWRHQKPLSEGPEKGTDSDRSGFRSLRQKKMP